MALLDIAVGGGVKMSTGVFVLYADARSFTFATPQGHQFAGWITFSAERSAEATVVQTQVLLRAGDPLYELGMPVMHRMEDRFWAQTMIALGKRLGAAGPAVQNPVGMPGPPAPMAPGRQCVAELHGPQRAADRGPAARRPAPPSPAAAKASPPPAEHPALTAEVARSLIGAGSGGSRKLDGHRVQAAPAAGRRLRHCRTWPTGRISARLVPIFTRLAAPG